MKIESSNNIMEGNKHSINALDLLKYILSFFVVAIHSNLALSILSPWVRLAVPLFFIISSWILFKKINQTDPTKHKYIILNYCKRNALLYLFWFIVLLPITIIFVYIPMWQGDIWTFVWTIIRGLLFQSSFAASWFISASIFIGVFLFITRRWKMWILIIIGMFLFALCCIRTSYSFIYESSPLVVKIVDIYEFIFGPPFTSFPIAFVWMLVGRILAKFSDHSNFKIIIVQIILIIVFAVLLFCEQRIVLKLTNNACADCYFCLLPLSILIFNIFKSFDMKIAFAFIMRKISVITYVTHFSCIYIFRPIIQMAIENVHIQQIVIFSIAILISHIISLIILSLQKNKFFKFLKWSN